ncbi:MAG: thermonuclease family protein [Pseudomonadota bacterium]
MRRVLSGLWMMCTGAYISLTVAITAAAKDYDGRSLPLDTPLTVTVDYVIDGDSVKVLYEGRDYTLRLQGIDAPELDQPMGDEAHERLNAWVAYRRVTIQVLAQDRYKRWLVRMTHAERDVNLAMVEAGLAWCYVSHTQKHSAFSQACERAEDSARSDRLGLWADEQPMKPSQWRKTQRNERELAQRRIDEMLARVHRLYRVITRWLQRVLGLASMSINDSKGLVDD